MSRAQRTAEQRLRGINHDLHSDGGHISPSSSLKLCMMSCSLGAAPVPLWIAKAMSRNNCFQQLPKPYTLRSQSQHRDWFFFSSKSLRERRKTCHQRLNGLSLHECMKMLPLFGRPPCLSETKPRRRVESLEIEIRNSCKVNTPPILLPKHAGEFVLSLVAPRDSVSPFTKKLFLYHNFNLKHFFLPLKEFAFRLQPSWRSCLRRDGSVLYQARRSSVFQTLTTKNQQRWNWFERKHNLLNDFIVRIDGGWMDFPFIFLSRESRVFLSK